jgi:cell wall-associated protease
VTFTAQAQGSDAPAEYRFWLYRNGVWEVVRDYVADPTWTLPSSTAAGTYAVSVHVRTSSEVDRDAALDPALTYVIRASSVAPATGVTLTSDLASPQPAGTAVTFTAQGQGSSGPYEYRFWLYRNGVWEVVQDYGSDATWTLPSSTAAGTFAVSVHVRTSSEVDHDAVLDPAQVYMIRASSVAPATGVTLTSDLASPQPAGTAVTFTAQGQGSSGPYEYRFWLYRNGAWEVVQDYSTDATWTLPTTTPRGAYDISVHVRTSPGVAYDAALSPATSYRLE